MADLQKQKDQLAGLQDQIGRDTAKLADLDKEIAAKQATLDQASPAQGAPAPTDP